MNKVYIVCVWTRHKDQKNPTRLVLSDDGGV